MSKELIYTCDICGGAGEELHGIKIESPGDDGTTTPVLIEAIENTGLHICETCLQHLFRQVAARARN